MVVSIIQESRAKDYNNYNNDLNGTYNVAVDYNVTYVTPGYNILYETWTNDALGGAYSGGKYEDMAVSILNASREQEHADLVFAQWDRQLERRDDKTNSPGSYYGVALPLWKNAQNNSIAQYTINGINGVPAIKFLGNLYGNPEGAKNATGPNGYATQIQVVPGTSPGTYDITEWNVTASPLNGAAYKEPGYTFTGVTLDPNDSVNYIEKRINTGTSPNMITVIDLRKDPAVQLEPVIRTSLLAGNYYTVHDDMYIIKAYAKAVAIIKNDPVLSQNPANVAKADAMLAEIERTLTAEENLNGLLSVDLQMNESMRIVSPARESVSTSVYQAVYDTSGLSAAGNNGFIIGDANWVRGYEGNYAMTEFIDKPFNGALEFDGTNSYIRIDPSSTHAPQNNSLYFEAWISPADIDDTTRTIAAREDTWQISLKGNKLVTRLFLDGQWSQDFVSPVDNIPETGEFYHIQVTASNIDNKLHYFINAIEQASFDIEGTLDTEASKELDIAALKNQGTYSCFFNGIIDNVRIGDVNWYINETDNSAYIRIPKGGAFYGDGFVSPTNYMALRGTTLLNLFDATGNIRYKNTAEQIGNNLKSGFEVKPVDPDFPELSYLVWTYWQ